MMCSVPLRNVQRGSNRFDFDKLHLMEAQPNYDVLDNAFTHANVASTTSDLIDRLSKAESFSVVGEINTIVPGRVFDKTMSMNDDEIIGSRLAIEGTMTLFAFDSKGGVPVCASTHIPFHAMLDRSLDNVSW